MEIRAVGSLALATVITLATSRVAHATVVVGTGNPDVDIPAVQAAVSQGGEVTLQGRFSFDRPPTIPTALVPATIRISTAVRISGAPHTSIEAGTIPFYVDAPGASVTIQNLHFIRPTNSAILVSAVSGLTILSCKIEGIVPLPNTTSSGLYILTTGFGIPTPDQPGHPENISGRLVIANNDIDAAGGTAADNTLGITVFSVGRLPDRQVDIYVTGNAIRNITEPAINFRRIGGRAFVKRNVIMTGSVVRTNAGPEVIRIANTGSFLIAHNTIDCEWPDANAKGIGVFSQVAEWPMEHAVVTDNDINMSAPDGTVFGDTSAGINVRGFAQNNVVQDNRIRGRARAALSVDVFPKPPDPRPSGIPADNAFVLNRFNHFEAALADVFVDDAVMNTLIVGQGTVEDHGVGTVIVRQPNKR